MINVTRKAAWKSGRVGKIKQLHNAYKQHYAIATLFLLMSVLPQAFFALVG
jgi:hypothetical protein